jgi:hypothetical protein
MKLLLSLVPVWDLLETNIGPWLIPTCVLPGINHSLLLILVPVWDQQWTNIGPSLIPTCDVQGINVRSQIVTKKRQYSGPKKFSPEYYLFRNIRDVTWDLTFRPSLGSILDQHWPQFDPNL